MADELGNTEGTDQEFEAFTVEDMLQEFVEGLQDAFGRLDQGIVALEQDPGNEQLLNDICRAAHSVKGTAAFMELTEMSELAHKMEDLLDGFRKGGLTAEAEFIDLLLDCLDAFRAVTDNAVQQTGEHFDLTPYFTRLDEVGQRTLQQGTTGTAAAPPAAEQPKPDEEAEFEAFTVEDMLQEFVEGLQDAFGRLDQGIVALEQDPGNEQLLNDICRAAHSVKGTAAFMELTEMSELAHKMEDLLDGFRKGGLTAEAEFIDLLLDCLDAFRAVTDNAVQKTGEHFDLTPYFTRLDEVARQVLQQPAGAPAAPPAEQAPPPPPEPSPEPATDDSAAEDQEQHKIKYIRAEDMQDEFYEALTEALEEMEQGIVALEGEPGNAQILNNVSRAAHSVKGIAGFLTLPPVVELAHDMETGLNAFRQSSIPQPEALTDVLLSCLDAFRHVAGSHGCDDAITNTLTELRGRLAEIGNAPAPAAQSPTPPPPPTPSPAAEPPAAPAPPPKVSNEPAPAPAPAESSTARSTAPAAGAAPANNDAAKRPAASTTLRVSNDRIDDLMNLVGELVIARNRLAQLGAQSLSGELRETVNLISTVSTELHRKITAVRMVPVEELFNTFPRLVRDVSRETGKKVQLELSGLHTELDKTLIEAIRDPMIHLIRNCVDHGIEAAELRAERGKPATGRLAIGARQAQNYVIIDIEDDGGGIDPLKVRRKAVEKGLISEEESARMSDDQAIRLIFSPGFSTAEKLTGVSGRGVGMDVVRQNVESLGGSIEIHTEVRHGSHFGLKLPLTLAIISALLVRCSDRIYAIPLSTVNRTVAVPLQDVERMKTQAMVFLQDHLLPLVALDELLGTDHGCSRLAPDEHGNINVVVVGLTEKSVGLVVQSSLGIEEIVIKPLGPYLGEVDGIGGATILGDGSVIMVLDPVRLIRNKGV